MKKIAILALAIAAGASLSTMAEARDGGHGRGEHPAFEEIDANGDGAVTREEITAFRTTRGAARFEAADTDGNGSLSAAELTAAAQGRTESRVTRMLERLDTDGDGALSQAEMEAAREGRGQRGDRQGRGGGFERMFERADADDSGSLSAEEWAQLGQHRGGPRGRN
ncbi:EF-hand domain-containing protein [Jannaschia pohangensis]|uniref:Ca2+-binding protein, EF-hand superfamily n=1 Tax=Jannaschia pohangensis TaxID=390807 RepID=A0A1I3J9A8_9RHOB|nr:EF-hand domain-containing protein [Jannaschia pohangensis]SFI56842.1 Ca2+-binding protein, EF-hand superfamily [Jannaschia pohangensis]